ncbi:hypothetical protein FHS27_003465 [Rhodopirellula rubra]|uniref:Uncharacterized protein n=1 Tax=Aporhodopirellula rubra TaxID=980271 RepID=A0A7W5H752_9BACT|nr:hypothetical protein [Aporhodopirellula rubra]
MGASTFDCRANAIGTDEVDGPKAIRTTKQIPADHV